MTNYLLISILPLLLLSSNKEARLTEMTDPRDGNTYRIIQIGDLLWFRDNLKFETEYSFCPNFCKDKNQCNNGNYYSNKNLDQLCPTGWRLPSYEDWGGLMRHLLHENQIKGKEIDSTYEDSNNSNDVILIKKEGFNLLESEGMMNFRHVDWVEGNKLKRKKHLELSYWMKSRDQNDTYHIHLGKSGYNRHQHKHNIIDKPKRQRKFSVRCVCDAN